MASKGILYRGACTFGAAAPGEGEVSARRRAWLTARAVARVRGWAKRGEVIAVGDAPPGNLPVRFVDQRKFLDPDLFRGLNRWAALAACGWYKRPERLGVAEKLSVDGIDCLEAVEYEMVSFVAGILEQVRFLQRVAARHPGLEWYADEGHEFLPHVAGAGFPAVAPLAPGYYRRAMEILAPVIYRRRLRSDLKNVAATRQRKPRGKTTILFPNPGINPVKNLLPALRALKDRDRYDVVIAAPFPETMRYLTAELRGEVRVTTWNDYWEPAQETVVRDRYRRFRAVFATDEIRRLREESYAGDGVSLAALIFSQDRYFYEFLLQEALRYATLGEAILRREEPALVVFPQDRAWTKRAMVDVVRRAGVPSLVLHNFQISEYPETIIARLAQVAPPANPTGLPELKLDIACDRATLMGEDIFNRLTGAGCAPEKLAVTGLPRLDGFAAQRDQYDRAAILAKYGIPAGKPIILFPTQPPTATDRSTRADRDAVVKVVCETIRRDHPEAFLIVKPHPEERQHAYAEVLERSGAAGTVIRRPVEIFELIAVCDLLITFFSSSALEAMLFDKPVVIINVSGRPDPISFVGEGAALGAYSLDAIPAAITQGLEPGAAAKVRAAAQAFARRRLRLEDGAARRIAELIETMAQQAPSPSTGEGWGGGEG